MNTLQFDHQTCEVRRADKFFSSNGFKPVFSFEYDLINYSNLDVPSARYVKDGVAIALTSEQCAELETYISTLEADPQSQTNLESQFHLLETDWYVVRKSETGASIPTHILASRAAAREAIVN
tara:strand:+ start:446 stop:814 length:369 start_codon:yes stop_codon:yes gene_type:complete